MSSIKQEFGQQVRKLRKAAGLSQEQLAEKTNLSVNFIGRVERGESWISPEVLEGLQQALDVKAASLFVVSEESPEYDRAASEHELAAIRKLLKGQSAADLRRVREILERFFEGRR